MPFDGTEFGMFENHPLADLEAVERLIANEERWCKRKLRDSDGRHCLVGAMQAVEALQVLEPIVLRAAREVGGKRYWRIEFFDDPHTAHADALWVLRRAREHHCRNDRRRSASPLAGKICASNLRRIRDGNSISQLRFPGPRQPVARLG
jgi:hypothetical protein